MTVSVTDAIAAATRSFTFDFRSTTLGLVIVLVLVVLLFVRDLLKPDIGLRARSRVRALDVAVWPLFITFGLIISIRLLELI